VTGLDEMTSRVPVRGEVATADMAAREAETKLDPRTAGRQTLLAAIGPGLNVECLIQMRARKRGRADEPSQGVDDPRHTGTIRAVRISARGQAST
jgi:hypothetical protein